MPNKKTYGMSEFDSNLKNQIQLYEFFNKAGFMAD